MDEFTIGLALFDFVPVLFTGMALLFIAQLVRVCLIRAGSEDGISIPLTFVGAGLVTLAGLLKAVWKLLVVTNGQNIGWMANALFPLMAPGFTLVAIGVGIALRRAQGKKASSRAWFVSLIVIALVYAAAAVRTWGLDVERGWFMPIMTLASLANLTLTGMLMVAAWRRGRWWVSLLFTVNVLMVFALQQIAQIEPMTIAIHWFEQSLTSVGAAAFALAAFLLLRLIKITAPQTASRPELALG